MNPRRIFDMAYQRSKFIDRLADKLEPVVSHICLIIYANTKNIESPIDHWISEVKAISRGLLADDLKGVNSYKKRKKAILEAFEQADLLKVKQLYLRNSGKFEDEGFAFDKEVFEELQSALLLVMSKYVEAFALQDLPLYNRWLQSLYQVKA